MNTDCLFITLICITVKYAFLHFIVEIIKITIKYIRIHIIQKKPKTNQVPPRPLKT